MATDDLTSKALTALDEVDGPMPVEVVHRLLDAGAATDPITITAGRSGDDATGTAPNNATTSGDGCPIGRRSRR